MLGKLIKNEIKQTFRSVSTIYIIVGVLAVVLLLASVVGATFFKALANVALFVGGFVMVIMTIVAIIRNFYESLYGRQGYLSFTLPVKGSDLLFSKILVSIIWLVVAVVLMGLIYFVMYIAMTGENGLEFLGQIENLVESFGLAEILPSKGLVAELMIIGIILLLLNFVVLIGFIYFSVTVANTRALQSHPKAYGIIVFLVTYIAVNGISEPITQHFPLSVVVTSTDIALKFTSMNNADALLSFGIAGTVFKSIIAIGLLVLTGWIMEHKVNVK